MRISTNMMLTGNMNNINTTYEQFVDAQATLASGKKLNVPSDDPAGTAQALSLQNSLDQMAQFQKNVNSANAFMGTTDNALSSAQTILTQARTIAVQGATDTSDPNQRQNLAYQITSIQNQLAALGNTSYGSRYIFGGQQTTQQPFVPSGSSYAYQGGSAANGNGSLNAEIGQGEYITMNVTGDQAFSGAFKALDQLKQDLTNNNASQISNTDIANLDQALQNITQVRANLGAQVQRLTTKTQQMSSDQTNLTSLLSQIQDADVAQATVNLQSSQLAYQAALTATSKGFQQNLVNYMQ
jgi:flagellar hook-associated protein 3 FlgL